MPARRPLHAFAAAALLVATMTGLAACSDGSSSKSSDTITKQAEQALREANQTRQIQPFYIGALAALGDWQVMVKQADVGPTTTVQGLAKNVGTKPATLDAAKAFALRDGVDGKVDTQVASATGLEAPIAPNASVPFTLTFTPATVPATPVLSWHGDKIGSFESAFWLSATPPPAGG